MNLWRSFAVASIQFFEWPHNPKVHGKSKSYPIFAVPLWCLSFFLHGSSPSSWLTSYKISPTGHIPSKLLSSSASFSCSRTSDLPLRFLVSATTEEVACCYYVTTRYSRTLMFLWRDSSKESHRRAEFPFGVVIIIITITIIFSNSKKRTYKPTYWVLTSDLHTQSSPSSKMHPSNLPS